MSVDIGLQASESTTRLQVMRMYTIGHSNHTWERFLALLREHNIELLVDVRSRPASRWARFANKRVLPQLLDEAEIAHSYLGDAIGGKPADPALYDESGQPDYAKIADDGDFQRGIAGLLALADGLQTAIMCAEEDLATCHRSLLIGPALREGGVALCHIRKRDSGR